MSSVGDGSRAILPTLTPPRRSLELTGVPADSASIPRRNPSMATPSTLSAASLRTTPPVISTLMQEALADPALISLAAGFVDQESLPNETTAASVAAILADPIEGKRALAVRHHDRRPRPPRRRPADARADRAGRARVVRAAPAAGRRHAGLAAVALPGGRGPARPGRHRPRRVADLFRLPRRARDPRRPGDRRADRRGRAAARRARGGARGDRGAAASSTGSS